MKWAQRRNAFRFSIAIFSWCAFFYALQALASLVLITPYHLPPFLNETLDVKSGLPGIEGLQHISTDAKGFRTTKQVDYKKSGGLRIFAIGGSTTEQIYLDDRRTWTHLLQVELEKRLGSNIEVINTGLSGTRLPQQMQVAEEVAQYHPDALLFLLGANDWNYHIRRHFFEKGISKNAPEPVSDTGWNRLRFRNTLLGRSALYLKNRWLRREGNKTRLETGEYYAKQRNSLARSVVEKWRPTEVDPIFSSGLRDIFQFCKLSNFQCLFLTQPTGYHPGATEFFRKSFWMTPPNEAYTLDFDSMVHVAQLYNQYLLGVSKLEHFGTVDLAGHLIPSYNLSYGLFYDDMHFNTAGAARVAEILGAALPEILERKVKRRLAAK